MDAMMSVFWGAAILWSVSQGFIVFSDKNSTTYKVADMVSTMAVGAEIGTLLCHFLTA